MFRQIKLRFRDHELMKSGRFIYAGAPQTTRIGGQELQGECGIG